MKEKIKDFLGLWLSVIFEHKWLYRFIFLMGIVSILFLFQCSMIAYAKQLRIIVASIYQFQIFAYDYFAIVIGYLLYKLHELKVNYYN